MSLGAAENPPPATAERGAGRRLGEPPRREGGAVEPRRALRDARRRLYGWVAAAAAAVLLRLPDPCARALSRGVGARVLRARLGARAREQLRRSLGDRLSEAEQEAVLDEVFEGFGRLPAELLQFARMGPAFLDRLVDEDDGLRAIHDFEERARCGWIGMTGHVGNWELLGQWLFSRGRQPFAGILVKRQPNPHLNRVIERVRGRHGMNTLYTDQPSGDVVRLLRAGHSLGVAGDQDVVDLPGIFLDFLGRPAYTPVGPARLALAADVPIMVGAMLREGRRFRVCIRGPIVPDRSRPRREEIRRLTEAWSGELEQMILDHPGQWAWFHRRWKTTPERLARRGRRPSDVSA